MNGGGVDREASLQTDDESKRPSQRGRTVILGFDALDFEYVVKFIDDLPNLASLLERGTSAPLESTHPPWTGSAWPSLYTGRDPSHHGVYDFFTYDGHPDTATLVSRKDVHAPALWNYLSAAGLRSVVMNVPVTHPADEVEGVLVPGYLAPEDTPGYPADIRDELTEVLGEEYTIYSRRETGRADEAKLAGYVDLIDLRKRSASYLLSSREWDFAFLEVQKTDAVFHNFDDEAAFRRIYRAADEFVGAVLEAVDDTDNVLVVSDHGIGPKHGYTIYLNEILREHGYVVESESGGRGASLTDVKESLTGSAEGGQPDSAAVEGVRGNGEGGTTEPDRNTGTGVRMRIASAARKALGAVGISPADVYTAAQRVGLESVLLSMTTNAFRDELGGGVDWAKSAAYCRSNAELGVRINLDGRDPGGVVAEAEYESVRKELIDLLESVETPDGNPAFDRVVRAETVYSGPYAEDACDVLLVPAGMDHIIDTNLYGRPFVKVNSYDHDLEGVFIGAGPGFDSGFEADSLSLTDVAPMTMALLGQPVPTDMTGSVPPGLLTGSVETAQYEDVEYGTGIETETTDDQVTNRLEDLGYL